MRYLFDHQRDIKNRLAKRNIFLFLDYDGTLSPIVKIPKKARISKKCKVLLEKLSRGANLRLAVISGRSLADVKKKVGIKRIIYSGNHGLEVAGPGLKFSNAAFRIDRNILKEIKKALVLRLAEFDGAIVEDKGATLSVHYRMVATGKLPRLKRRFKSTVGSFLIRKKIRIRKGKKVFEIRPPTDWDKGKIVSWLLKKVKFSCRGGVVPVYIGDDRTDEDAFRMLKTKGLTIFVGKPKRSSARYYLKDTGEVIRFLRILQNLLQSNQ